MLQQETRVDADQDGRAEPAEQAQQAARAVAVLERGFLAQGARAGFPNRRDDARGGVEDEETVRERDEHRRRDGAEGREQKGEGRVDDRWERRQHVQQSGVRGHDDGWEGREVVGRWRGRGRGRCGWVGR